MKPVLGRHDERRSFERVGPVADVFGIDDPVGLPHARGRIESGFFQGIHEEAAEEFGGKILECGGSTPLLNCSCATGCLADGFQSAVKPAHSTCFHRGLRPEI